MDGLTGGFSPLGMLLPSLLTGGADSSDFSTLVPLAAAGLAGGANQNPFQNISRQTPDLTHSLTSSLLMQSMFSGALGGMSPLAGLGANPLASTGIGGLGLAGAGDSSSGDDSLDPLLGMDDGNDDGADF